MGFLRQLSASLGQALYPAALRIEEPGSRGANVEALLAAIGSLRLDAAAKADTSDTVKIANIAWRLDQLVGRLDSGGVGRAVRNRVDALNALLKAQQVTIEDYSGRPFDPGELWDEVVSDQTMKQRPMIGAMKLPRIKVRGAIVQRGTPEIVDGV